MQSRYTKVLAVPAMLSFQSLWHSLLLRQRSAYCAMQGGSSLAVHTSTSSRKSSLMHGAVLSMPFHGQYGA